MDPVEVPSINPPPQLSSKGIAFIPRQSTGNVFGSIDASTIFAANVFGQSHNEQVNKGNRRMERASIILLVCLGIIGGLVNGFITFANSQLGKLQAVIIHSDERYSVAFLYFILTTLSFVFVASFLCKRFTLGASGSGLPEFKSLLTKADLKASDYNSVVSLKILLVKMVGLIFSVGSGLSVGSEGPLVHVSACVANVLLTYIPEFERILDSPNIVKQIFAASAAVGISSAFNAPIGGLLFSVEATSTFYLISNYWKSCIAAASGAAVCYFFLSDPEADPLLLLQMSKSLVSRYEKWELVVFFLMGVTLGFGSRLYLHLHQRVFLLFRPYNKSHPLVLAQAVALISAVLIYTAGSYNTYNISVISLVSDVVNTGETAEMRRFNMPPLLGLCISLVVRVVLTLIATNILVPAGILMPVLLLGGLFGRFVGTVIVLTGAVVNSSSYALVGAVAFAAGITQTVSVAVIGLELTGNIELLLPLLVVAVTAAGISRMVGLSVYDQGMINKGLENFQLLLTETGGFKYASEVMTRSPQTLPKNTSVAQMLNTLYASADAVFPVIDTDLEISQLKLLGTVRRRDMFKFLEKVFTANVLSEVLWTLLPSDAIYYDDITTASANKAEKRRRRTNIKNFIDKSRCPSPPASPDVAVTVLKESASLENSEHNTRPRADTDDASWVPPWLRMSYAQVPPVHDTNVPPAQAQLSAAHLWSLVDRALQHAVSVSTKEDPAAVGATPASTEDEAILSVLTREVCVFAEPHLPVNTFPFTVTASTPMEHVYVLFEMVKASVVFVLDEQGALCGVITGDRLIDALREKCDKKEQ